MAPIPNRLQQGARKKLAEGGGTRFLGWEVVIMFYEIVIAVGGYAAMGGMSAPRSHAARRSLVMRHLPHLAESYDGLCGLSLEARYYKGYAMTKNAWRRASQCRKVLTRNIPT